MTDADDNVKFHDYGLIWNTFFKVFTVNKSGMDNY